VHHEWYTGMHHLDQHAATCALMEQWNLLVDRFNSKNHKTVIPFTFSRPSESRLAYQLLGSVNSGCISLHTQGDYPAQIARECWQKLRPVPHYKDRKTGRAGADKPGTRHRFSVISRAASWPTGSRPANK